MPYCPYCGKSVNLIDKFCSSCGSNLKSSMTKIVTEQKGSDQQVSYVTPETFSIKDARAAVDERTASNEADSMESSAEIIRTIFPELMLSKGIIRVEVYTLIVTDRRSIFAKLTDEVEKQAIQKFHTRIEGAERASGVVKWIAKRNNARAYVERYSEMTPDSILNETPGNFALDDSSITDVRLWDDNDEDFVTYFVTFTTKNNVFKCRTMHNTRSLQIMYSNRK